MIKHIYKAVFLLLAVSILGCSEDYLDTYPTNSVSPEQALSTPDDMMAALNGIHRSMYGQSTLDNVSTSGESYIIPKMEFCASDALHSTPGNGWFKGTLRWLVHTNANYSDTKYVWWHYYHIIGSVNNIINASTDMEASLEKDEIADLHNILGQAYAYRAWAHHRLVVLYAKSYGYSNPDTDPGVPIVLKNVSPFEGNARASVSAVYAQCESDIEASLKHFAEASSPVDNSHISIRSANGIAARIALSKCDYVNAAKYAKAARTDFDLMGENEFKSGFNSSESAEVMWGAKIVADQTNYYKALFYFIGTNFNGSQNRGNPKFINHELYKLIGDNDYRADMWLEKAPNSIAVEFKKLGEKAADTDPVISGDENYATRGEFWAAWDKVIADHDMTKSFNTYPYMSVKFKNKNGGTIEPDDVVYMRASEMYLIEAEALAKVGGKDAEAITVITELANARRSDMKVAYDVNARGLSLVDEIKVQRRIELWGEGFRWTDMKRYDEALDLTNSGANTTLYSKGFSQAKPSVNVNWVYQIPQAEINANGNITQDDQNPSAPL